MCTESNLRVCWFRKVKLELQERAASVDVIGTAVKNTDGLLARGIRLALEEMFLHGLVSGYTQVRLKYVVKVVDSDKTLTFAQVLGIAHITACIHGRHTCEGAYLFLFYYCIIIFLYYTPTRWRR